MTATITGAPPATDSPYVGLTYFTEEYSNLFFGRDDEAAVIIGNLCAARLTLLYAESGVGKSSLLRAGVAAALRRQARADLTAGRRPRFVPVTFSAWTGEPVDGVLDALDRAAAPFAPDGLKMPRTSLEAAVESVTRELDTTLLIILDQFEEYFLYHSNQDGHPFAEELARCVGRPDLRVNFLIAIREDGYSRLGDLFRGRIPNVYSNFLHLEYLNRHEGLRAITGPVDTLRHSRPQLHIEPALVEAVLDGVRLKNGIASAGRAGTDETLRVETTYLQLVMRRIWDEERAAGSDVLRLDTLKRLGGAQEIIEGHLNRAMSELPRAERDTAASVFRFLVTRSGAKIALSVKDLAEVSGVSEETLEPVLRRLASGDAKILRLVATSDGEDSARYEIFHDALARPIVRWREDYRVERERQAKIDAESRAAEAEHREAVQRKRKRIALGALGVAVTALVLSAIATTVIVSRKDRHHVRTLQSIQTAERLQELGASPSFGEGSAAVAAIETERHLAPTFEARNAILSLLQGNVAMPKVAFGHTRSALAVAFVSNNVAASGSADGSVRLWSKSGREIGKPLLVGPASVINDLAVNQDKGLLAAARSYPADEIDLWDVRTPSAPTLLAQVPAGSGQNAVAVSPSGEILAAGGNGKTVGIWDVRNPSRPRLLRRIHDLGVVRDLAFNTNGALVSASDGGLGVWARFGMGKSTPITLDSGTLSVAVSPNAWIALAVGDQSAPGILLEGVGPNAGKELAIPTTDLVNSLEFADGGKVLVGGGDDFNVTTWDVGTQRVVGPPRMTEQAAVNGVAVSPDGGTIAWADDLGRVDVSSLRAQAPLAMTVAAIGPADQPRTKRSSLPRIHALALLPGGRVAAAAGAAGLLVWKLDGGAAARPLAHVTPTEGSSFALATHGNLLAVSAGAAITLWRTSASCSKPCRLGATRPVPQSTGRGGNPSGKRTSGRESGASGTDIVESLAFGPNGDVLYSADHDGNVDSWDVSDPRTVRPLENIVQEDQAVFELAVSPQAKLLAAGGQDGTIRLWDISNPLRPRPVGGPVVGHHNFPVSALAFSPDGKLFASGGEDQQVTLWSVDSAKGLTGARPARTQSNTILALAFSPEGDTLAAADGDGSVCLYEASSGRYIGSTSCLLGHSSRDSNLTGIRALQFTQSGGQLISAGDGNPVVAWNAVLWDESRGAVSTLTADVCRVAERNLTLREWNAVFTGTPLAGHPRKVCASLP